MPKYWSILQGLVHWYYDTPKQGAALQSKFPSVLRSLCVDDLVPTCHEVNPVHILACMLGIIGSRYNI